jgi:hypothetical protein
MWPGSYSEAMMGTMNTTQEIFREYIFLYAALVNVIPAGDIMLGMHQVAEIL